MSADTMTVAAVGPGRYLVRVQGDVDVDEALALMDTIVPLAGSGAEVDLDLDGVTFLGSSGLRAVATALRAGQEAGGRVVVVAASRVARRVLELAGMALLLAPPPRPRWNPTDRVAEARRMRSAQN